MNYVLKDKNGKYFALSAEGKEDFTAEKITDAIIFGDAHRSPSDAPHDDWTAVDVRLCDDGDVSNAE